jgi:hypothetical protein
MTYGGTLRACAISAIQDQFLRKALERRGEVKVPLAMRLLQWFPVLRRLPARLVGVGIRPEHVRVPGADFRRPDTDPRI